MSLLSLPAEIIHYILAETRPDGFENLMLTSKYIYHSGQDLVAIHNKRSKVWRDLEIRAELEWTGNIRIASLLRSVVDLLGIIAAEPIVASYIRFVTIRGCETWNRESCPISRFLGRVPVAGSASVDCKLLEGMIRNSTWLQAAGCDIDKWVATVVDEAVKDPNDEARSSYMGNYETEDYGIFLSVLTLLLTELVNLNTLNISFGMRFASDPPCNHDDFTNHIPLISDAKRLLDLMSVCVGDDRLHIAQALEHVSDPHDRRTTILRRALDLPVSPLDNMREVHYCTPHGYERSIDSENMNAFITSPNVRRLYATSLQACETFEGNCYYHWPKLLCTKFGTETALSVELVDNEGIYDMDGDKSSLLASRQQSAIEHLELVCCCMDSEGIQSFVERMPSLATLRYTHQTMYDAEEHGFDAGWFLMAIAEPDLKADSRSRKNPQDIFCLSDDDDDDDYRAHVEEDSKGRCSTLIDLAIGLEDWGDMDGCISTGISPRTMKQFTALQRLSLDVRLFLAPTPESCERYEYDERGEDLDLERPGGWKPDLDLPRLIDILPATLQELELFVPADRHEKWCLEDWPRLLEGFREGRHERLPNLKKFVVLERVEDGPPIDEQVALSAGAEYHAGEDIQMEWRREFEERETLKSA